MISVFICMPYGDHNSDAVRENNAKAAMGIAMRLADSGFLPYCPHLSHYLHGMYPRSRSHWLWQTISWVDLCDCVLAINGPTEGMRQEIAAARKGNKPVFTDIKELARAYGMELA